MRRRPPPAVQRAAKRAFDVVVSAGLLIVLAPVLGLVAVLVRSRLGSPVLFCQQRPGLAGRPFTLYKFRTMTERRLDTGEPAPDWQRLTSLGRLLRASSLDELPELWNVLRGDMSLVGPRPLLPEYLELYTPEQARRHEMRPGITGWAQVNGRNAPSWEEKLALDVWYVDHWSLKLDLRILARTLVAVLRREGISQPGHVTAERFQGTGGRGEDVRGRGDG